MAQLVDTFTRDGSRRTANNIQDYWAKRGFVVNATTAHMESIRPENERLMFKCYEIRSDMIDGYPRALWETRNA